MIRLLVMQSLPRLLLVAVLMSGCTDMYDQPSFKPQEGPRLMAPEGAVPVRGIEKYRPGEKPENPVSGTPSSIEKGKALFHINCAMCHGPEGRGDGLVGKKLVPPAPDLHAKNVQGLGDTEIYSRITEGFGRMPAFQRRISAEDRWHLANYVKGFNKE